MRLTLLLSAAARVTVGLGTGEALGLLRGCLLALPWVALAVAEGEGEVERVGLGEGLHEGEGGGLRVGAAEAVSEGLAEGLPE